MDAVGRRRQCSVRCGCLLAPHCLAVAGPTRVVGTDIPPPLPWPLRSSPTRTKRGNFDAHENLVSGGLRHGSVYLCRYLGLSLAADEEL